MSQQLDDIEKSLVKATDKLENPEKDTKGLKKGKWLNDIKFYYGPLIVLLVFFLIIRFGVYGAITNTFGDISEIDKIKTDVKRQTETIKTLESIRQKSSNTKNYLYNINKIAPIEQTNVSNYQTGIRNIALLNALIVKEAMSGEEILAQDEGTESNIQLVQVPTTFRLEGSFDSLKKFLADIYNGEDFIIIEEMSFNKDASSDKWSMEIVFVKYQFIENIKESDTSFYDEYVLVSENLRPNEYVIDFLDQKYIDTQETNTTGMPQDETNP